MSHDSASDPPLSDADQTLADQLVRERARPTAAFRGALGRRLAAQDPGFGPRPPDLWRTVSLFAVSAVIVLTVGVLQAVGAL